MMKYTKDTVIDLQESTHSEESSSGGEDTSNEKPVPVEARSHLEKFEKAIGYSIIRQLALDPNEKKAMISNYLKKPAKNKNDELQRTISMFVKESALKNDMDQQMQSDDTKMPQVNYGRRGTKDTRASDVTGSMSKLWLLDPQDRNSDFKTIDPDAHDQSQSPSPLNVFQVQQDESNNPKSLLQDLNISEEDSNVSD